MKRMSAWRRFDVNHIMDWEHLGPALQDVISVEGGLNGFLSYVKDSIESRRLEHSAMQVRVVVITLQLLHHLEKRNS
ncbi:hypothetical protein AB1L42_23350 [Thalassoglobus sp. JC818]|uniref:hypothetical protein n=1 Tax=Thalassoglobus sp. JC818 TaxID=3232136 RepID=UPI003459F2DA